MSQNWTCVAATFLTLDQKYVPEVIDATMSMHRMVNFVVTAYGVSSFPHRQYCCTFYMLKV